MKNKKKSKFSEFSERKTQYTSISNLYFKKDKIIKILANLTSVLSIISMIIPMIFIIIYQEYTILEFNFKEERSILLTNFLFFVSILFILIGKDILTIVIESLTLYVQIKDFDSMFMKLLYKDLKYLFSISKIFFSAPFILGLLIKNTASSLITAISLNFVYLCIYLFFINVLVMGLFCYITIKEKRNLSFISVICLNIFTSSALSFAVYGLLHNVSNLIYINIDDDDHTIKPIIEICASTFYEITVILLIAYYKDIVYPTIQIIITIGILITEGLETKELQCDIALCSISAIAILITLIKYRLMVFGYDYNDDSDSFLNKLDVDRHKVSNFSII